MDQTKKENQCIPSDRITRSPRTECNRTTSSWLRIPLFFSFDSNVIFWKQVRSHFVVKLDCIKPFYTIIPAHTGTVLRSTDASEFQKNHFIVCTRKSVPKPLKPWPMEKLLRAHREFNIGDNRVRSVPCRVISVSTRLSVRFCVRLFSLLCAVSVRLLWNVIDPFRHKQTRIGPANGADSRSLPLSSTSIIQKSSRIIKILWIRIDYMFTGLDPHNPSHLSTVRFEFKSVRIHTNTSGRVRPN